MSMIDPQADLGIFAFQWVPDMARGHVRDLRPRWACEEAAIPYREELIDVTNRPQSYFDIQPWGQVPAMLDGDIHVFESGAMLLYLGEKSELLLPRDDHKRATVISWLLAALNTVEPPLMELSNINMFAAGEEWTELRRPSLEAFIRKRLAPVEKLVGAQDWLGGAFSIADIAMVAALRALDDSPLLDEHPAIASYIDRGLDRPACRQALSDQLAAFDRHPNPRWQER